jgi:hypothetical protein
MVYATYKNCDLGDGLLLFYPHYSSCFSPWDFFREALEVMCGELQMTGVLVATKDKQGLAL